MASVDVSGMDAHSIVKLLQHLAWGWYTLRPEMSGMGAHSIVKLSYLA